MKKASVIRFWRHVVLCEHVRVPLGEHFSACAECCWIWSGTADQAGYGRAKYCLNDGEETTTGRIAWGMAHQGMNPPEDKEICHTCNVRLCCNPAHLWLGTHADNMADRAAKGRSDRRGGFRPHKLTWSKVADIRELGRLKRMTQAQIGAQYGISAQMVSEILSGRAWGRPSDH